MWPQCIEDWEQLLLCEPFLYLLPLQTERKFSPKGSFDDSPKASLQVKIALLFAFILSCSFQNVYAWKCRRSCMFWTDFTNNFTPKWGWWSKSAAIFCTIEWSSPCPFCWVMCQPVKVSSGNAPNQGHSTTLRWQTQWCFKKIHVQLTHFGHCFECFDHNPEDYVI